MPSKPADVDFTRLKDESNARFQKFISQQAAAERWSVSVDTIRRLVSQGKIRAYRLNNRIIRVDQDEVDSAFRPIPVGGAEG